MEWSEFLIAGKTGYWKHSWRHKSHVMMSYWNYHVSRESDTVKFKLIDPKGSNWTVLKVKSRAKVDGPVNHGRSWASSDFFRRKWLGPIRGFQSVCVGVCIGPHLGTNNNGIQPMAKNTNLNDWFKGWTVIRLKMDGPSGKANVPRVPGWKMHETTPKRQHQIVQLLSLESLNDRNSWLRVKPEIVKHVWRHKIHVIIWWSHVMMSY